MEGTDWLTAIAVVASGLLIGAMVIRHVYLAGKAPSEKISTSRVDLEAKRDSLLQQLRELDDTSSKLAPEQVVETRANLEIEAAKTLRDLERFTEETATPETPSASPRPASAVAGFAWGMAATLAIVGIVFFVSRSATQRAPAGSLTGNLPNETQQPTDDIAQLEAAVARDPNNLEVRLELARAQLYRQNLVEVAKHSSYVLERDPRNPRALSFQAFVRMAVGEEQIALTMLEQALAIDPDLLDAWIYLAVVRMRLGEYQRAVDAIAEAKRRHPAESAMLDQLLAEMQSRSGEPATLSANEIGGTIELDPSRDARSAEGRVVFVIARAEGTVSGPPLAVKRLMAAGFPLEFRIGQNDSMMGQSLPQKLRIEARVDGDGDPMTREASDPSGIVDGVNLGTSGVRLVLQ